MISPEMFPGEMGNVLSARLEGYLTVAYADARVAAQTAEPTQNSLAFAWAHHLAFMDVYLRLTVQPASVTLTEKGSHSYLVEQLRNMKALADKYLADFNGLLLLPPASPPSQFPGTMSVRNVVDWFGSS